MEALAKLVISTICHFDRMWKSYKIKQLRFLTEFMPYGYSE